MCVLSKDSRNSVLFYAVCSRIAVFSVSVLHDERIVVVAEQRPDASEEDSFQWMSRVLQVPTLLFLTSYYQIDTDY